MKLFPPHSFSTSKSSQGDEDCSVESNAVKKISLHSINLIVNFSNSIPFWNSPFLSYIAVQLHAITVRSNKSFGKLEKRDDEKKNLKHLPVSEWFENLFNFTIILPELLTTAMYVQKLSSCINTRKKHDLISQTRAFLLRSSSSRSLDSSIELLL